MKTRIKLKELLRKRKTLVKVLAVMVIMGIFMGGTFIMQAASAPKAWIASYADGRTSGLRVSEMLEVKTSGFASNAKLKYEYEWSNDWAFWPYNTFTSPDTAYSSYAYGDKRYVAVVGSKSTKDKLTVKVKDVNASSATYGKTVTASYKNFKSADLSADLSSGAYGMFVGEDEDLLYLLGKGGVLHITCGNSSTESCTLISGNSISVSGTGNDTVLTAERPGESRCRIKVKKKSGCTYHPGQTGSGDIIIYVFGKPTAIPKYSDSIVLSDTEAGVTYTVNGVSKTCTKDGQKLVFEDLQPETKYKIECSKVISGKKVFTTFNKTTNGKVTVQFDRNEKGSVEPSSQTLYAGNYLKQPEENVIPTEPGFVMEGWCEDKNGTTEVLDFEKYRVPHDITLYAKWTHVPNTLNISLNKDGEAWKEQSVELYVGNEKAYELVEDNGLYSYDNIKNGTYDIYVNGEKNGQTVLFNTTGTTWDSGQTVDRSLEYYTLPITTYRNDVIDGSVGEITLRQEGEIRNTVVNENGQLEIYALDAAENNTYEVYIDGVYTERNIVAKPNAEEESFYFYDVELKLTYSSPWTDAKITMRDENGVVKGTLYYDNTDGNTCTFKNLVLSEQRDYDIYVETQNSGKKFKLIPGKDIVRQEEIAFYRATVSVKQDDVNKTNAYVTLYNGTDYCRMSYDSVLGKYVADVPVRMVDGVEQPYEVLVKNSQDKEPAKVTTEASNADVSFYTIKCHVTLAGEDIVTDLYVRANTKIDVPASPTNNGLIVEGWYADAAYSELFDFSKVINSPLDMYGKFESQKATINEYIKTDADGKIESDGEYYRMANLTISGYPDGNVMNGFIMEVTGCELIEIIPNEDIEMTIAPEQLISDSILTIDNGTIIVQFESPISMKELQKFIRNNIIVKPDVTKDHTMTVTVFGTAN